MQPISYFCMTCRIFVCGECTTLDHTTENGHSVVSISKSETNYLKELNISNKSLSQNKRNLQLVESEIALLTAAKEMALKDMETFIKLAQEKLQQRRNDLKEQILNQFKAQQKVLLDEKNQIQEAITIINKNIIRAKKITKAGDVSKLKPICENLKEINEKTQSILTQLDLGENYLAFDSNKGLDEFNACLHTLGDIYSKGFLPSRIRFQGQEVMVGQKTTLTVELYNHQGDKLPIPLEYFSVHVTNPTNTEIYTQLSTTAPDYTVTFTPQVGGLHQVSGSFLRQKLTNEQTHISVSSDNPVLKLGQEGTGKGNFNFPWGIAIDNDGCIYVADSSNRLIQKFSARGEFLSEFPVNVHDADWTTVDIALDLDNGLIYCTAIVLENNQFSAGNNMLVFNLEGQLQHVYPLSNMPYPICIAINNHGNIIMSDITKKCLFKVDKEGKNLSCIRDLKYPGYITISDDDSIIVSDRDKSSICIYNSDGTLRHKFGSSGAGEGELKEPLGVASDGEYILVADSGNSRIQVFKIDGTFVSMIKSQDDPLRNPKGLAVTNDGHVYVVDSDNHCIKKYKYRNVPSWNGQCILVVTVTKILCWAVCGPEHKPVLKTTGRPAQGRGYCNKVYPYVFKKHRSEQLEIGGVKLKTYYL